MFQECHPLARFCQSARIALLPGFVDRLFELDAVSASLAPRAEPVGCADRIGSSRSPDTQQEKEEGLRQVIVESCKHVVSVVQPYFLNSPP